jgi:DNA-directed RNA polymerase specialized sigma24 family protein
VAREAAGADSSAEPTARVAFDGFYREQWAAMVRLAWLMTGSRELAEDLVQDAFVHVGARWSTVETPVAYLRVAVVNAVRADARRGARQRALPRDPLHPVLPLELDETWHLLERLTPRQRQALVLRFYADLPFDQIADALQCRLGTAKSLVHRGLARLKELMEP